MPDRDREHAAIERLSDRITETKQDTAEQIDILRNHLAGRLDQIIGELQEGKVERKKIIGELTDVKDRLAVVEDTAQKGAMAGAYAAGNIARTTAKTEISAAMKLGDKAFWDGLKARSLLWFAGIAAAGGAIAAGDDVARFVEGFWNLVKKGGQP